MFYRHTQLLFCLLTKGYHLYIINTLITRIKPPTSVKTCVYLELTTIEKSGGQSYSQHSK